jgi:signal transduction histidine kinase/DNA-binding response OmpR family regulator
MKILIADDSPTIVDVVQYLLQSHGYEVITASDGIEAILKTYQTSPDLVLLDIEMPKMNGYQVCRLLKSDETTKAIPIIILTSRDQKSDRFWGISTGADEFMTKDFESEGELFTAIQNVLKRRLPPDIHAQTKQIKEHSEGLLSGQQPTIDSQITEISVLERVNHILDRQLFQATIVNELSYLAINMHSFPATIDSIFTLLGKVCEFHVASIFLKDEDSYNIFLYVIPPVSSQFLETTKQRIIHMYSEHHPTERIENLEVTILQEKNQKKNNSGGEQVATFFALPLKVRNNVIGILALSHSRENTLNPEIINTLHVFTNEASIVLDNAQLFRQLEQSNCELENTISELKNTQAQLVQSEKMASLGQLVAGVAHEINTPSGAINAATANLMNFLSSVTESFRLLAKQNISQADQKTLFAIVSQLIESVTKERKSTMSLRQDAKDLEKLLAQEGFDNVRRLAKQISRFNLKDFNIQLLRLLKKYDSEPIIDFLETCSKIVNASKDIRLSINVITRIVNALKMYSRLDQAKVEEVDIHEGLETTLIILQSQIKQGIEVERCYGDIPKIPCYANELNQVWTNIIHNALQAMNKTGTLTIETYLYPPKIDETVAMTEEESLPLTSIRIGEETQEEKIGIKITDTGPGIPREIQDKIFDPYFTTKDQGEGSGLGLGIAQQIVERHHGEIRVKSKPGKTSFEVLLPISAVREEYLAQ